MPKVKKHRAKKSTKCPCLKGWVCEDHPNQPWGQGSCAKIHDAIKIRILFFYPSIVGCSPDEENRLSGKLHSTLNGLLSANPKND
jgi:hypothetical protein